MAHQKFSAAEREAIWLAHEKKCAYTRELIDVSSFHIDHIVPENLADDSRKFEETKAKLNLGAAFDLTGFGNLLPSKPGANEQKSSIVMEPARIHYFLAIAADKKAEIEQRLQQIEKRRNRGRALILLQQCLERGELSAEEARRILEEHGEEPHEIFRLVEALEFADATEVNAVAKADIEDLRRRPGNKWWAWVDLNHRPRPYQGSVVRFYNNIQDRGDCQSTRKSYKTSYSVGWIVG